MRRIAGRFFIASLSACLLSSGVTAISASPASAGVTCSSVDYFSAKGSGDDERPTNAIFSQFKKGMSAKGVYLQNKPIHYNAPDIPKDWVKHVAEATSNARAGAKTLKREMNSSQADCIVLAGYSLGAFVIQIALAPKSHDGVSLETTARKKIKAVVLEGSPKFRPSDRYAKGDFNPRLTGIALGQNLPTLPNAITYCKKGDPVCNNSLENLVNCHTKGWDETHCPHLQYATNIAVAHGKWLASLFSKSTGSTHPPTSTQPTPQPRPTPTQPAASGKISLVDLFATDTNGNRKDTFRCKEPIQYRYTLKSSYKEDKVLPMSVQAFGKEVLNPGTTFTVHPLPDYSPIVTQSTVPVLSHDGPETVTVRAGSETGTITFNVSGDCGW